MTVKINIELINQIRDDAELTAMARVIEDAQRQAWWQGFGSDWDKARISAYMLRAAGFGLVGDTKEEADEVAVGEQDAATSPACLQADDRPDDERHAAWCRGGHEGRCRRGRLIGTEKQAAL
jgi:hypothetical protein